MLVAVVAAVAPMFKVTFPLALLPRDADVTAAPNVNPVLVLGKTNVLAVVVIVPPFTAKLPPNRVLPLATCNA